MENPIKTETKDEITAYTILKEENLLRRWNRENDTLPFLVLGELVSKGRLK